MNHLAEIFSLDFVEKSVKDRRNGKSAYSKHSHSFPSNPVVGFVDAVFVAVAAVAALLLLLLLLLLLQQYVVAICCFMWGGVVTVGGHYNHCI